MAYLFTGHRPDVVRRLSARLGYREPMDAVLTACAVFKVVQLVVFGAWLLHFGSAPWLGPPAAVAVGALLIAFGQALNLAVFWRLGRVGVFYGVQFGYPVPWCHGFPFNFVPHPQYLGVLLSIWGLFLATRFPHPDWVVLPLLETTYYVLSSVLEAKPPETALVQPHADPPDPSALAEDDELDFERAAPTERSAVSPR